MTDTPKWKQDAEWDAYTPEGEQIAFVRCEGRHVAVCSAKGHDNAANAQLFAAAPALYAALVTLLDVTEGEFSDTDSLVGPQMDAARAALKKARGIK